MDKTCTKCRDIKPLDAFSSNNKAKDKKHSWCRACVNTQRAIRKEFYAIRQAEWTKENREQINAAKRSYQATPHGKQLKREADIRYVTLHKDSVALRKKLYGAAHPEKRRASYQRHKESYVRRYYERKYKIETLTPLDANRDIITGAYVRAKELTDITGVKHEVDHIVPISLGGLHHQDNLQVMPWLANREKGNRCIYCLVPRLYIPD
jgi:hypothetical protein